MKMKKSPLKLLGVLGHPVSHSLSPLMHNTALSHLGLPYLYMPFDVAPEKLEDFIASLPKKNLIGLNVTIPHKQSVIPFLGSLSRDAKLMGAVNTILIKGNKLFGYNTDALGYLQSLKNEAHFDVKGKHAILLGAGGAAKAIAVALSLARTREVHIINRTEKKAHDLIVSLSKKFPQTTFSVSSFEKPELYHWANTDLLINATPMGMKGKKLCPLPLSKMPSHTLVSDIVYNPLETPLLKKARQLKLKTHSGWGMLLYQGALSFQIWTKKEAPVEIMKTALLQALKDQKKHDGKSKLPK